MSTMKFNKWQSVDGVTRNAVLQVVSADVSNNFSTTSTTFVDATGLALSITPTSATSKILVTFNIHYVATRTAALNFAAFQILRGSTVVYAPWLNNGTGNYTSGGSFSGATTFAMRGLQTLQFVDSPATTNSTTYKLQVSTYLSSNTGTVQINETSTSGTQESTIILMEIAND